MIDLKRIQAVALDIAEAGESYDRQDALTDFIWNVLQRHYQMYLFSTSKDENLAGEDFNHPRLTFLREDMPPSQATLNAHPALLQAETLWITDDSELQRWIAAEGLPFMHLGSDAPPAPGGQRLARLSELSALLDPTALMMQDLVGTINDLRRFRPQGALLVGVGGPPQSGYQDFALHLRRALQDAGHELVELLDLSPLLASTESLLDGVHTLEAPWVSAEAGEWLATRVLAPLREGESVYEPELPTALPADFEAHFPLYISEGSVVITFSELVFIRPVAEALDLSILLEMPAEETTRRLYDIPPGERFDPKFTEQFRKREGRIYDAYLQRHQVRERASLRVDASREGVFQPAPEDDRQPLV